MSQTRLSLWLNKGSEKHRKIFRTTAELSGADKNIVVPVKNGFDILNILNNQDENSIDHILISGHGGPTWLLNPRYGIVNYATKESQVDVSALAKAIDRVSTDDLLISLAACLCSRSPSWYLRLTGAIGSDWGPRGYRKGGRKSFSGKLRDCLFYHGKKARIRGHRVSGHAANCAILAEHKSPPYTSCETLFERALPGFEPTLKNRNWWIDTITGELAQRWLLGDDSVEHEISRLYYE